MRETIFHHSSCSAILERTHLSEMGFLHENLRGVFKPQWMLKHIGELKSFGRQNVESNIVLRIKKKCIFSTLEGLSEKSENHLEDQSDVPLRRLHDYQKEATRRIKSLYFARL